MNAMTRAIGAEVVISSSMKMACVLQAVIITNGREYGLATDATPSAVMSHTARNAVIPTILPYMLPNTLREALSLCN